MISVALFSWVIAARDFGSCGADAFLSLNVRRKNSQSLTLLREDLLMGKDWYLRWLWVLLWVHQNLFVGVSVADRLMAPIRV